MKSVTNDIYSMYIVVSPYQHLAFKFRFLACVVGLIAQYQDTSVRINLNL